MAMRQMPRDQRVINFSLNFTYPTLRINLFSFFTLSTDIDEFDEKNYSAQIYDKYTKIEENVKR